MEDYCFTEYQNRQVDIKIMQMWRRIGNGSINVKQKMKQWVNFTLWFAIYMVIIGEKKCRKWRVRTNYSNS